jgi:hypothetical protein
MEVGYLTYPLFKELNINSSHEPIRSGLGPWCVVLRFLSFARLSLVLALVSHTVAPE